MYNFNIKQECYKLAAFNYKTKIHINKSKTDQLFLKVKNIFIGYEATQAVKFFAFIMPF